VFARQFGKPTQHKRETRRSDDQRRSQQDVWRPGIILSVVRNVALR
jgi:hypothetical protein